MTESQCRDVFVVVIAGVELLDIVVDGWLLAVDYFSGDYRGESVISRIRTWRQSKCGVISMGKIYLDDYITEYSVYALSTSALLAPPSPMAAADIWTL